MKTYQDKLLKMRTKATQPVTYFLQMEGEKVAVNDLLDHTLSIQYKHKINCIACGAETNKSFHQGYCYSCFKTLPQTDVGILHPEKDRSQEGISRDMEWAKKNMLVDHYVYLALTSNLKVGVTRAKQVPTRWIDQGASHVIRLAKTPYRKLAGDIEVFLKQYVSDKTKWQQMLLSPAPDIDLKKKKLEMSERLPDDLKDFISLDDRIERFIYPGQYDFDNIQQINLDKEDEFTGKLIAVRGQYLIFEQGMAFNVRKHNGYLVKLEIQ
ncbi:MAG: DUF2797 domain-containing protein [Candidatus Delongbacteria bacterium]|jgi:hypothetical protein|nr:DUF2797 domain-containing protein [Candidatus Delongbacteria bacterium]